MLVIILTSFTMHGVEWSCCIFGHFVLRVSAWGQWLVRKLDRRPVAKLKTVVDEVAQGRFNRRVTGISESSR